MANEVENKVCLNVLYYGRLISTVPDKSSKIVVVVSMSFTTDVSFLRGLYERLVGNDMSQCPLLRTSHFYITLTCYELESCIGLNVLYNERLISTLPLSSSFIQAIFKELFCMWFSDSFTHAKLPCAFHEFLI